jgi:hypothetical protein
MHPWMLQLVADEHRRDLLDPAGRWRLLHRQAVRSARTVQAESSGRFWLSRRRQPGPSVATAVPATSPATATYAC